MKPMALARWVTLATLILTLSGSALGWVQRDELPQAGERRLEGVVRAVDPDSRILTLAVTSSVDAKGKEFQLAEPQDRQLLVPASAPIRTTCIREAWQSLSQVKVGDEVTVFAEADGIPRLVRFVLVHRPAPEPGPLPPANPTIAPDKVCEDKVVVPMVFPFLGNRSFPDTFLAPRGGGTRRHLGTDIMAPPMEPMLAVFDGTVRLRESSSGHKMIYLYGDNGWTAIYMHVNNDRPGTDDGQGGARYAFAPGLSDGDRIQAGHLIGFNGDSGNAESAGHHLHLELWHRETDAAYNPYPSLKEATVISEPVYPDPLPDWKPPTDKLRVDGEVQEFDATRQVLVVETLAKGQPGAPTSPVTVPRYTYLKLDGATLVGRNGKATRPEDLSTGDFVMVVAEPLEDSTGYQAVTALAEVEGTGTERVALAATSSRAGRNTGSTASRQGTRSSERFDLGSQLNRYRQENGAEPLEASDTLTALAQAAAREMMVDGEHGARSIVPVGVEILLDNESATAEEAWQRWLKKPELKERLLNGSFSDYGFAHAYQSAPQGPKQSENNWVLLLAVD
jgi:uncharacterized protein YkwD